MRQGEIHLARSPTLLSGIVVELDVRGRDVASFVSEAQKRISRKVALPAGYYIRRGGQFENLQAASRRLAVVASARPD